MVESLHACKVDARTKLITKFAKVLRQKKKELMRLYSNACAILSLFFVFVRLWDVPWAFYRFLDMVVPHFGHLLLPQDKPACFGTMNLHLGHTHSLGLPTPFPLINPVSLLHYVDDMREVITLTDAP